MPGGMLCAEAHAGIQVRAIPEDRMKVVRRMGETSLWEPNKGAAESLPPWRESMALNRYRLTPRGRTAGHLSGSDRATRCPAGKEPCREELHLSLRLRFW
jgi:hypothetical protein